MSRRVIFGAALALLALAATTAAPAHAASCRPQVVDLGTLPGAQFSVGLALGPDREVVGWGYDASGQMRPLRWPGGRLKDLGLPHTGNSIAYDVNAEGTIVGVYDEGEDPTASRPFVWRAGRVTTLPGLRGGAGAVPRRISDTGLIVGWAFDAQVRPHPVMWVLGHIVDLGIPPGFDDGLAFDVTPTGEVAGTASKDGLQTAFRWRLGRFQILPTLATEGSAADAIGLRRDVVG